MATAPPLHQSVGYGVVIGVGFLFALGMMLTTFILRRYNNEIQTSEGFSTAGRSVKSGLVASAVVSSWTWAATLLQSTAVAYDYGVSGGFWYASGATVQIILFATLAISLKKKAPNAHTFLEVIKARYGVVTHLVFITFALMTNILVTAMLLTGGSAVVNSLTGMPTPAGCFLLPLGVVLYTLFGGIKATFLTDYVHTVILIIIILIYAFTAWATSPLAGSPSRIYDLLVQASARHPVEGNAGDGSYLTMRSQQGGIFFVINLVGNFGTVFMDQGYYQKAIAASPVYALPGYVMGGLAWFAIPWVCATTMGLSALALENNPVFPTYPNRMSKSDVTAGLVLPNAAVALLGKGGAAATLLLLFLAVTSAMSAELVAVSSIATYDLYQPYFAAEKNTTAGAKLIRVSHISVVVYAVILAGFSTGLWYAGISMGYLYLLMGVIISAAVIPASLTLLWRHQSWAAATFSPPLGLACALIAWLVTAKNQSGALTVESTGSNNPMLAGNVVALLSPMVFVPILTLLKPQHYDWASMAAIRRGDDADLARRHSTTLESIPGEADPSLKTQNDAEVESKRLEKASRIAKVLTVCMALCFLVLWPMPMYGEGYVFSKPFFRGWVVVGFIWLFVSAGIVVVWPVVEGRGTSGRVLREAWGDLLGWKGRRSGGDSGVVVEGREVEDEKVERDDFVVKGKS